MLSRRRAIDDDMIAIPNGREDFRASVIGEHGAIRSLLHELVGSDGYEQSIHLRTSLPQVMYMSAMNDVETAMAQAQHETFSSIPLRETLQLGNSMENEHINVDPLK